MRPIDADALKEKINITFWSEIGAIIDNAPTIEPKEKVEEILNYLDTELHPIVSPDYWYVYRELHDMIASLLFTDKPQGKWIFNPKDAIELMFTLPKCSECGFESADCGNYCPNCGKKMKGEDDDL